MDNTGKAKLCAGCDEPVGGREENAVKREHHWKPLSKHPLKLHQLNAEDVDAVFAEGKRAINSLRDVQVTI